MADPTSRPQPLRSIAIVKSIRPALLLLILVGCERPDPVPAPAAYVDPSRRIRLVDRIETAIIESAVDLGEITDPDSIAADQLVDRIGVASTDLGNKDASLLRGDFGRDPNDHSPRLDAGDTLTYAYPASPDSLVRCTVRADLSADAVIDVSVYECDRFPAADQTANRTALQKLLGERLSFQTPMIERDPSGTSDDEPTWSATLPTRFTTGGLLVVVHVEAGTANVRSIEKARYPQSLRTIFQQRETIGHPHARRISWNRDARESILIAAPGRLHMTVEDAAEASSLLMSLAAFDTGGARIHARIARGHQLQEMSWNVTDAVPLTPAFRNVSLVLDGTNEREPITIDIEVSADRSTGWVALATPTLSGAVSPATTTEPQEYLDPRPDVVLVSLDTVRADRLSIYGGGETCPNLAQLAQSATVFDQAIAAAPWTLPSHASIFTGQLPDHHRIDHPERRLDPSAPMVTIDFRNAGYETVAFTAGGFVHPDFGFAAGFERYHSIEPADPPVDGTGPMDRFLQCPTTTPRFLFIHTYAAHAFSADPADLAAVGVTQQDLAVAGALLARPIEEMVLLVAQHPDPDRIESIAKKLYDASLLRADRVLGRVIEAQRSRGRLEKTFFVVLSDHGQELFDHDWVGHGLTLYEEQLHVPLVISGPKVVAQRVSAVVSLTDVAPTLRSLIGLEGHPASDGRSLAKILGGGSLAPRVAMASRLGDGSMRDHAFRTRDRKVILGQGENAEDRPMVVYDLEEDPGEQAPLPEHPEHARWLRQMTARIRRLQTLPAAGSSSLFSASVEEELRQLGYLGGE